MARKKTTPKKLPPKTRRNLAALHAVDQKAVVMKDRREPKGGARNRVREDLREAESRNGDNGSGV